MDPIRFNDALDLSLTLKQGENKIEIPGSEIRELELELASYGWSGALGFTVTDDKAHGGAQEDTLHAWFGTEELIEVTLEVRTGRPSPEAPDEIETMTLEGLVRERELREEVYDQLADAGVLRRYYGLTFADPAQVLWRQHWPFKLYTDASWQDLIDDQKSDGVRIDYDWEAGTLPHDQLFLALGGAAAPANFYDFVAWLCAREQAVFSYDYTSNKYKITTQKAELASPPNLPPEAVGVVEARYPEVPRHSVRVWNSYTAAPACEDKVSDFAAVGILHEHLLRTSVQDQAKERLEREAGFIRVRAMELELGLVRYPDLACWPGSGLKFHRDHRWGAGGDVEDTTWRVVQLHLHASAVDQAGENATPQSVGEFDVGLSLALEQEAETCVIRSPYTAPVYPHWVEGIIVSDVGEEPEETAEAREDPDTGVETYAVKIPVFDDQLVAAPFDPSFTSGHFYTPAYKGERVLLAFDFESASISRFLDWRAGARMPREGQGNRIQLGLTPSSRTTLTHEYEDNSPVFRMVREHDEDTATLEMKEGELMIEVREGSA